MHLVSLICLSQKYHRTARGHQLSHYQFPGHWVHSQQPHSHHQYYIRTSHTPTTDHQNIHTVHYQCTITISSNQCWLICTNNNLLIMKILNNRLLTSYSTDSYITSLFSVSPMRVRPE